MPNGMVVTRAIVVGVVSLFLGSSCQVRAGTITPQTIADLNANRWTVRRNAFEQVAAAKDGIDNPKIRNLLINLREKENLESNRNSVNLFEDDDYLAYDEELTPLIQKIAEETHDPRAWKSLVYGRYNGDSVFGNWIASHRETLPFLLKQLESPYAVRRATAAYVVANMLAKAKSVKHFQAAEYRRLKQRLRSAAATGHPAVRQSAMKGLALTKDSEDAPFLEKLAKTATDPDTRQYALAAAKQIRESAR